MRVHIGGARGSTAAPGPEFVRYGGHTSCVGIAHDAGPPTLVLDAGTGVRRLNALFDGDAFAGTILLGHVHWDHIQGLPFFRAADRFDARVDVYVPGSRNGDAEEVLARFMSPPTFPIRPSELRGRWDFRSLREGRFELEGFEVLAREIPHKGGMTFGFRVTDGDRTVSYLSDHDANGIVHDAARALVEGADVLIHDAQYTTDELVRYAGFGHCTIDYAADLAEACGVGELLLFHHAPERTDDELDAIVESLSGRGVAITAAREGDVIDLPRGA